MANCMIGEIQVFGFNYAPASWAMCNGQTMNIRQSTALYAVIGVNYGGDGKTTFILPDLRGRVAIGQGQAQGLTNREIGDTGGVETYTLSQGQMPSHNHGLAGTNYNLYVSSQAGTQSVPDTTVNTLGMLQTPNLADPNNLYNSAAPDVPLNSGPGLNGYVSVAGSNPAMPVPMVQPTLALNYCIALEGEFPIRN